MSPVRAVACDLFGTLVRMEDPLFRRRAPELLGVSPRAWIAAVRQVGLTKSFTTVEALAQALVAAAGASGKEREACVLAALKEQLATARLQPGALPVLRFLRQRGLKLALVSNLSSAHEAVLDLLGLREVFDVLVLSCRIGRTKPEAEVFRTLCRELGFLPSEILVVGDSPISDGAARNLGFPVLLVGSPELLRFFDLGWYPSWGPETPVPLVFPGQRVALGGEEHVVERVEPLEEGQGGRYNLLAVVETTCGRKRLAWYVKRFWDPAGASVDALARAVARDVGLSVVEGFVLAEGEPVSWSRPAGHGPFRPPLDPSLAFDLGAHLAFAYAFANADIRPRNALVFTDEGGRRRLRLIDLEHCFLNLALPPEVVAPLEASRSFQRLSLEEARRLAQRQVITPKTILRARNEFFPWREAGDEVRQALAEGFSWCWTTMQGKAPHLLGLVRHALASGPPLRVGTWRFRRPLAPFDVEEMAFRLQQPLAQVLPLFVAEG
ncbi:MAG: HAD family hydrolase [Thermoanaerobaculum sp.]